MSDGEKIEKIKIEFAQLADDFFVLVLLAKKTPELANRALPWIFSHILELSLKASCIIFGQKFYGHDLSSLWSSVQDKITVVNLWPEELHFEMYRKVFIREGAKPILDSLPAPEHLYKAELAYWIDNIVDLKYGFDLKSKMVSIVHISYEGLNPAFLRLFKTLRDTYRDSNLNKRYEAKIKALFPNPEFQKESIGLLI